jgi:hypothetical protein
VIGLVGSVINRGENVFAFQGGVIGQNLFEGSPRSKQFKNVRDPDALAPDARPAPTFAFFYCYASKTFQVHRHSNMILTSGVNHAADPAVSV